MAEFETLNTAIDALSTSVDDLVARLDAATVEDPAVQAAIDEAVSRIKEVQGRIDALAGGGAEAPNQDLPGDQPVVDHR